MTQTTDPADAVRDEGIDGLLRAAVYSGRSHCPLVESLGEPASGQQQRGGQAPPHPNRPPKPPTSPAEQPSGTTCPCACSVTNAAGRRVRISGLPAKPQAA